MYRQRSHLSQGELAQRIGIRQGPLSNLENGKNLPSAKVLMRLRNVLQVTTDQILDAEISAEIDAKSPSGLMSRMASIYGTKQIDEHGLRPHIETILRCHGTLQSLCCSVAQCASPMIYAFELTNDAVERVATRLRAYWGIEHTVYIHTAEILEAKGARVFVMELAEAHPLAVYFDESTQIPCIFLSARLDAEQQNYYAAYALARIVLFLRDLSCREKPHTQELLKDRLARNMALSFLMPGDMLGRFAANLGLRVDSWDFDILLAAKTQFGVSAETMIRRLERLCLISDLAVERFTEQLHNDASPKGETRLFRYDNRRLGQLLYCARRQSPEIAAEIEQSLREILVELPANL